MPHPLQHYSHYQPALLQSGYWGRGAMDPEPGRCRRTDGKKWRCARDVVGGHKYCERHMHRGRNRSRKPVEIPTPTSAATNNNNNGVGVLIKTNTNPPPIAAQPLTAIGGGGGGTNFGLSGPSHSFDLLHFNQRPSESITETKGLIRTHNNVLSEDVKSGGRILRHFFDDWPRSVQEPENTINKASPGTSLSISVPGNSSSDFSLKLSTGGNRDEPGPEEGHVERERAHLNWGAPSGWGTNQMGGPLAEALRSSTSTSSPTSVLHQLRGEASFIST